MSTRINFDIYEIHYSRYQLFWVSRGSSKWYPAVYKYTATSNIRKEGPKNLNLQPAS